MTLPNNIRMDRKLNERALNTAVRTGVVTYQIKNGFYARNYAMQLMHNKIDFSVQHTQLCAYFVVEVDGNPKAVPECLDWHYTVKSASEKRGPKR